MSARAPRKVRMVDPTSDLAVMGWLLVLGVLAGAHLPLLWVRP